jgi:hypothetical protein
VVADLGLQLIQQELGPSLVMPKIFKLNNVFSHPGASIGIRLISDHSFIGPEELRVPKDYLSCSFIRVLGLLELWAMTDLGPCSPSGPPNVQA